MTGKLPPSASVATQTDGAKLSAPAAARNVDALTELLLRIAPSTGRALELASGTGQHIVRFSAALPGLTWTPSDVDPDRLASITAYRREAALPNLAAPLSLDACAPNWGNRCGSYDLIVVINLLHLVSDKAARTLIAEAAHALGPGGTLMVYGPFLRDGQTTSAGDARFHADLRTADPSIGYKDRDAVLNWAEKAGLPNSEAVEMPANNLALVLR